MLKAWSTQQIAERWLHEFYTRLSNDPGSLHILYLDNAEAIYTGRVWSGSTSDEGYLMSGRSEIAGFFGCPAISAKFCGSKVKVDVVHPLPNPLCLNAISLSVKGTLFLPVNAELYESADYTHFLSLSPATQRYANAPVSYLVATEFLHIYRKSLPPAMPEQHIASPMAPLPPAVPVPPAPLPQAEPPLLAHPPHIMSLPQAGAGSPSAAEATRPPGAGGELASTSAHMVRRYNDELSLHAAEVTNGGVVETKAMSTNQILDAVNDALKRIGVTEGRCVHVMRPNPNAPNAPLRTFFFLHFNKIELVERLRKAGQLELGDGVVIKLNQIKRKYMNAGSMRSHRALSIKQAPRESEGGAPAAGLSTETAATSAEKPNGGDTGRRKPLKLKRITKI